MSKPAIESRESDVYDADYFLNGPASGKSLYEDYRWLPELTVPFAHRVIDLLGIKDGDLILDFGCARGYLVKAFRELGYRASGIDCSPWAIENCDEDVKNYVSVGDAPWMLSDWVIAKDVLEHLDATDLRISLSTLNYTAAKGFLIIVPLSPVKNARYTIAEYEQDETHLQRLSLLDWYWVIQNHCPDFHLLCSFRVPGMKENYAQTPDGNGFIVGRKNDVDRRSL